VLSILWQRALAPGFSQRAEAIWSALCPETLMTHRCSTLLVAGIGIVRPSWAGRGRSPPRGSTKANGWVGTTSTSITTRPLVVRRGHIHVLALGWDRLSRNRHVIHPSTSVPRVERRAPSLRCFGVAGSSPDSRRTRWPTTCLVSRGDDSAIATLPP